MVILKLTAQRNFSDLVNFFQANVQMNAYDCIQALDIALRVVPSATLKIQGRSFFSPEGARPISGGAEVWTGYYQSLRATQAGLTLNVDMSNTAFIKGGISVLEFLCTALKIREQRQLATLPPNKRREADKAISGLKVEVTHRTGGGRKSWAVVGLTKTPANQTFFQDDDGNRVSVADYFASKYQRLQLPNLWCLHVAPRAKNIFLPMEVCRVIPGQRVKKMDESQTSDMIKIAARPPQGRRQEIHRQITSVLPEMQADSKAYGIEVTDKQVELQARILNPPRLKYYGRGGKTGGGREELVVPAMGSWNMVQHTFYDFKETRSWAVVSFCGMSQFNPQGVANFVNTVRRWSSQRGTQVADPPVLFADNMRGAPTGQIMRTAYVEAERRCGSRPQLIMCIMPFRDNRLYGDIKLASDTQLGIPSQCILVKHAYEPKDQYVANVWLKLNAKLGGMNTVFADNLAFVHEKPTIVFGADVHHPGAGNTSRPSIAALVASMDRFIVKHSATVRAQGHRVEEIAELEPMVKELLLTFYRLNAQTKPMRIIFFRDGVSEGQFQRVLQREIRAIERACASLEADYRPTISFIVIQKRHHTRLFPADAAGSDRKGNCLPGTVVDVGICHPSEFDFYLMSHAGLQGTSRAAHYHVLWDENRFGADALQKLAYHLCYMYCRCTKSVSLVPAVYYAHLLAYRAQYFIREDDSASEVSSHRSGQGPEVNWAELFSSVHQDNSDRMFFV